MQVQWPVRTATKKGQLPVSCKSSAERGNLVLLFGASEPGERVRQLPPRLLTTAAENAYGAPNVP
jgi:hypothetical protein